MVALATLLLAVTFVIFWSWMLKHSSSCDHFFELFFFWGGMIEIKNQTWTFNAAEMCLCPSPDLCLSINLSQRSTDHSSDFMMWFVLWHVLSTVGSNVDRWVPLEITRDGRWKLDGPELNFDMSSDAVNVHVIFSICTFCRMNFEFNQFWIKAFNMTTCGISEGLWLPARCAVHTPHLTSGYMSLNNLHLVVTINQLLAQLCLWPLVFADLISAWEPFSPGAELHFIFLVSVHKFAKQRFIYIL